MTINAVTRGLSPQTRVKHQKFGEGIVTQVTPDYLKVSFQDGKNRTFAARIVEENRIFELLIPPPATPVSPVIQFPYHISSHNNPEAVLSIAEEVIGTPSLRAHLAGRALLEVSKFVERGLDSLTKEGISELRRLQGYLIEAIKPRLSNLEAQQILAVARGEMPEKEIEIGGTWEEFIIGLQELRRNGDLAKSKEKRDKIAEEIRQNPMMCQIISAAHMIAREMTSRKIGFTAHNILRCANSKSFVYIPEERAMLVVEHIRNVEKTWGKRYLSPDIYPEIIGEEVDLLEDRRAVTVLLTVLSRQDLRRRFLSRSLSQTIRSSLKGFQNYRRLYSTSRDTILEFTRKVAEELGQDIIPLAKGAAIKIPSYQCVRDKKDEDSGSKIKREGLIKAARAGLEEWNNILIKKGLVGSGDVLDDDSIRKKAEAVVDLVIKNKARKKRPGITVETTRQIYVYKGFEPRFTGNEAGYAYFVKNEKTSGQHGGFPDELLMKRLPREPEIIVVVGGNNEEIERLSYEELTIRINEDSL